MPIKRPVKPPKTGRISKIEPKAVQAAGLSASSLIPLSLLATEACCASELAKRLSSHIGHGCPFCLRLQHCFSDPAAQQSGWVLRLELYAPARSQPRPSWKVFLNEFRVIGLRLLAMFTGFAFIGYFINGLIPASWISRLFGAGNLYSVPLAATLGLPFYLNTEATLPLIRTLLDAGMSSRRGARPS